MGKVLLLLCSQEDFDIKKMTLNAVFAMQLHRFPDEVNELVVTVSWLERIELQIYPAS